MQRLLASHGDRGWLEVVLRHGRTFRYQGVIATCDPSLVEQLLTERDHTARRSRAHRFISWVTPGAHGPLFMDGPAWVEHVQALMPAFVRQHVDGFTGHLEKATLER